jgi:DNA-directed RNA polymerase subunit RPC12/RpoP
MKCACCGGDMIVEKELEKVMIYKCRECGLSNTELKKNKNI